MGGDELRDRLGCPAVTGRAPVRVVRPFRVLGVAALRERSRVVRRGGSRDDRSGPPREGAGADGASFVVLHVLVRQDAAGSNDPVVSLDRCRELESGGAHAFAVAFVIGQMAPLKVSQLLIVPPL